MSLPGHCFSWITLSCRGKGLRASMTKINSLNSPEPWPYGFGGRHSHNVLLLGCFLRLRSLLTRKCGSNGLNETELRTPSLVLFPYLETGRIWLFPLDILKTGLQTCDGSCAAHDVTKLPLVEVLVRMADKIRALISSRS